MFELERIDAYAVLKDDFSLLIAGSFFNMIVKIGALKEIFESMGQFVDGLKFSGGSHSLLPRDFVKEVTEMAHRHDIYVSTGDWAEHLLRKGPSGFKEYVEVRRRGMLIIMLILILWWKLE